MKRTLLPALAFGTLLLAGGRAAAQPTPQPDKPKPLADVPVVADLFINDARKAMYEDIEVMRRILERQVARDLGGGFLGSRTDKGTWLRRVYLDLTGRLPTKEETEAFLEDDSPDAYRKLIDGLRPRDWMKQRWIDPAIQNRYSAAVQQDDLSATSGKPVNTTAQQGLRWLTTYADLDPAVLDRADVNVHVMGNQLATRSPRFEGVYLKGFGVVFTATVPEPGSVVFDPHTKGVGLMAACVKCHEPIGVQEWDLFQPASALVKPDLWEQVRKEVLGVKDEPKAQKKPKQMSICGPGSLTESLLRVLADHGHHFQQLADNENISVVITLNEKSRRLAALSGQVDSGELLSVHLVVSLDLRKQIDDLAALGDLHMKQGKYAEAVTAYMKAIELLQGRELKATPDTPHDAVRRQVEEANRLLRRLYSSAARAQLELGKFDDARSLLDKARAAAVKVSGAAKQPAPPPRPDLPAKLIVTVPKSLLVAVHQGKVSFEDFKKKASVETVNLGAEKK